MYVMFLIYLTALGICIWFGPKVVAVLDQCNAKAEIGNTDALAGFIIGLIPVVNILFVFFGARILAELNTVLKEEQNGSKTAVPDFNAALRELDKISNDK